ncbi:MAG: cell division protein ZapA [Clostridiales bacterium]|nr:cell division protein ZapA [Clostridiales bacterium]
MPFINRVKLNICATDYVVTSEDSTEYMREVGSEVDHAMRVLLDSDPRISTTMAAVLTALTNADRARKAEAAADNLRQQMKEYLDDNTRTRQELERLRREVQELRGRHHDGPAK